MLQLISLASSLASREQTLMGGDTIAANLLPVEVVVLSRLMSRAISASQPDHLDA